MKPLLMVIFFISMIWCSEGVADVPNIEFVSVPAGQFMMGTPDLDEVLIELPTDNPPSIDDEQPAHRVELNGFDIGKYEITQQQWLTLMGTKPGPNSHWRLSDWQQLPVVSVNWLDTQAFIKKLNAQDKRYQYRLPTEAEWEYVARDGDSSLRPFELQEMDDYAWNIINSGDVPHPVGTRRANKRGIHDLYGNAWEWVSDWYQPDAYAKHVKSNPSGPAKGVRKIRRGGSYHCATHFVRAGYRAADKPTQRYSVIGFRLVRIKK